MAAKSLQRQLIELSQTLLSEPITSDKVRLAWNSTKKRISKSLIMAQWHRDNP